MRPGQTAKGSFKNSKSKGKTQVFVPIGKGEYFRDTILDALLFEGETILEY